MPVSTRHKRGKRARESSEEVEEVDEPKEAKEVGDVEDFKEPEEVEHVEDLEEVEEPEEDADPNTQLNQESSYADLVRYCLKTLLPRTKRSTFTIISHANITKPATGPYYFKRSTIPRPFQKTDKAIYPSSSIVPKPGAEYQILPRTGDICRKPGGAWPFTELGPYPRGYYEMALIRRPSRRIQR